MELRSLNNVENAIFFWGDGYHHGESYSFDHSLATTKYNIDGHDDMGDNYHIYRPSLFATHMWNTGFGSSDFGNCQGPKKVYTDLGGIRFTLSNSHNIKDISEDIRVIVDSVNLHLTIDLDSVIGFPAVKYWRDAAFLRLSDLMRKLNLITSYANIIRLDFGGVTEKKLTSTQLKYASVVHSEVLGFAIENVNPPLNL